MPSCTVIAYSGPRMPFDPPGPLRYVIDGSCCFAISANWRALIATSAHSTDLPFTIIFLAIGFVLRFFVVPLAGGEQLLVLDSIQVEKVIIDLELDKRVFLR